MSSKANQVVDALSKGNSKSRIQELSKVESSKKLKKDKKGEKPNEKGLFLLIYLKFY
jgi:hypothetical protein